MSWMLDTDTCVGLIRRRPPALIRKLVEAGSGNLSVSVITVGELRYGAEKNAQKLRNTEALNDFFLALDVLALDYSTAAAYGQICAALERRGTPIGSLELWIAAHALSARKTLVTHNTREFRRVPHLAVENWIGKG